MNVRPHSSSGDSVSSGDPTPESVISSLANDFLYAAFETIQVKRYSVFEGDHGLAHTKFPSFGVSLIIAMLRYRDSNWVDDQSAK